MYLDSLLQPSEEHRSENTRVQLEYIFKANWFTSVCPESMGNIDLIPFAIHSLPSCNSNISTTTVVVVVLAVVLVVVIVFLLVVAAAAVMIVLLIAAVVVALIVVVVVVVVVIVVVVVVVATAALTKIKKIGSIACSFSLRSP
jgi:hypothetical protein